MILYYLIFLAVMSLISFILYGADKKKAQKKAWRTPESVLLGFGFFGGAVGAIAGMNTFRHKTKHWYFVLGMPVILILHIFFLVIAIVKW